MSGAAAPTGAAGLGAVPLADGQVRFRLWAPDARAVDLELELEERALLAMRRENDGCFVVTTPAAAGVRYRYRIDGTDRVPDPASRWQPDGVLGASAVPGAGVRAWRNPDWRGRPWRDTVLYELHVGACGGYAGVRAQLPRLAAMGITAIELMPVNTFPGQRNWGYDGVFPYAPSAAYGTPDELMALVDDAHGLGLMVFLDVVYNHFGPEGNLLARYAGGFFRDDRASPWGAMIDFRREPVRRFFIDNALMWLREYRFDGLRLDAVHAIEPSAFLDILRDAVRAALPADRHVHLVLENENNQASLLARGYTAQWDDDFHNALHVLLTGEQEGYYADFADDPAGKLARVLGEGFAFQGEPDRNGRPRGEPSGHLPPSRFVVFAQNHDQVGNRARGERLRVLVSPERLRAALALVALVPMVPLFFMGEPWGARAPFLFFTDYGPPLDAQVREGRRREFAAFAAFADARQREAIPDPNAPATFAASVVDIADADAGEGAAWSRWFTALLAARRAHVQPRFDAARAIASRAIGGRAVTAAWHMGDATLRIAVNFGDAPVALDDWPDGDRIHVENLGADPRWLSPSAFIAQLEPVHAR